MVNDRPGTDLREEPTNWAAVKGPTRDRLPWAARICPLRYGLCTDWLLGETRTMAGHATRNRCGSHACRDSKGGGARTPPPPPLFAPGEAHGCHLGSEVLEGSRHRFCPAGPPSTKVFVSPSILHTWAIGAVRPLATPRKHETEQHKLNLHYVSVLRTTLERTHLKQIIFCGRHAPIQVCPLEHAHISPKSSLHACQAHLSGPEHAAPRALQSAPQ